MVGVLLLAGVGVGCRLGSKGHDTDGGNMPAGPAATVAATPSPTPEGCAGADKRYAPGTEAVCANIAAETTCDMLATWRGTWRRQYQALGFVDQADPAVGGRIKFLLRMTDQRAATLGCPSPAAP